MKWFSQRVGAKPIRVNVQKDSMDEQLRTRLWNVIYSLCLENFDSNYGPSAEEHNFMHRMWVWYINEPINQMPHTMQIVRYLQMRFFALGWSEVYDFLEAILFCYQDDRRSELFTEICNRMLEEELSAYRIIDGVVAEITSEQEITALEEALDRAPNTTKTHLKQALQHFSNRDQPDYRGSIKESISAVEAVCKQIAGTPNATLGEALNKIAKEGRIPIHSALKTGLSSIYGWTNQSDGIRHALMEQSYVSAEDAKFMLVSCSAFVNYLIVKADKAGIKL